MELLISPRASHIYLIKIAHHILSNACLSRVQWSDVNVGHCHSSWTPVFRLNGMDFGVNALHKVQARQSQLLDPKI